MQLHATKLLYRQDAVSVMYDLLQDFVNLVGSPDRRVNYGCTQMIP